MSRDLTSQVLAGLGFAALAVVLAHRAGLGLSAAIGRATARAIVQLAAVGAFLAAVFAVEALAILFVAVMLGAAAFTAGGRLAPLPRRRTTALAVIALPALGATAVLLLVGAFDATPRAAIPTAGILLGGAMTATSICGRSLLTALEARRDEIEARLCLGDGAREALDPVLRAGVIDGVIPVLDQTRSVGLVTLPGTFVGLVLGGASPTRAASTQLVVLLALLAVELGAALLTARAVARAVTAPGERIRPLAELEPA